MMVFENKFAESVFLQKYSMDGKESWKDTVDRVVTAVGYSYIKKYMESREFCPAGRYLYAAGRPVHNINNCFAFRATDTREGWSKLLGDCAQTLMLGGGIGIEYSSLRCEGTPIKGTGGEASGPLSLMRAVDAVAANVRQGGSRRSACWAGLNWNHPDVFDFIKMKHRTLEQRRIKEKDFNFYLPMELTNISVGFDDAFLTSFYDANHREHVLARKVWDLVWLSAFETADPGASFNFNGKRDDLRNACNEFSSENSGDSCNLGSIFINRIRDKDHMAEVTKHAVKFLLRGALYTNRPTEESRIVARENNRVGLGLGGIAEWLMQRGMPYEVTPELAGLLEVWAEVSETEAAKYAKRLGMNVPKATRAIAPNGTLAIVAESTGGIEPLFCKSYIRSRWVGDDYVKTVVVDPTAKRLIDMGIPVENIYDTSDIGFEQRVKFQYDMQKYVDMGISSTVNLPMWGTENNNAFNIEEKKAVIEKYMGGLRGLTVYSDGSIGGQPLVRMDLAEALAQEGQIYEGTEATCKEGVCGV
jgi:ribonucleoside-diphosphate reductase alpha chain